LFFLNPVLDHFNPVLKKIMEIILTVSSFNIIFFFLISFMYILKKEVTPEQLEKRK
jgi:hypothetical protein